MIFSRRNFMRRLLPISLLPQLYSNSSIASQSKSSALMGAICPQAVSPNFYKKINVDQSDSDLINSAIKECISSGATLDLRGGPWTITETIDLTEVKSVVTDFSGRIYVDPEKFQSKTELNFSVVIGDPDKKFRDGRTAYNNISGLFLLISRSRKKKLNGIFIKGALLSFDSIRVVGFNGSGCFLSSVWDSTFKSISCELCGNIDDYQININPGGDTSNCLNIGRIQSERAFHKCLYIDVIRSTINTIHAERAVVLTTDDGSNLPSGLKYNNFSLVLTNSVVNQVIHDVHVNPQDLNVSEKIASDTSSITINLINSVLNASSFVGGIISTIKAINSQFNCVSCKSWFFDKRGGIKSSSVNNSISSDKLVIYKDISLRDSLFSSLFFPVNAEGILVDKCDVSKIYVENGVGGDNIFLNSSIPLIIENVSVSKGNEIVITEYDLFTVSNCKLKN